MIVKEKISEKSSEDSLSWDSSEDSDNIPEIKKPK